MAPQMMALLHVLESHHACVVRKCPGGVHAYWMRGLVWRVVSVEGWLVWRVVSVEGWLVWRGG